MRHVEKLFEIALGTGQVSAQSCDLSGGDEQLERVFNRGRKPVDVWALDGADAIARTYSRALDLICGSGERRV